MSAETQSVAKVHKIFVANRGEIAVRIIDACARLGIDTVLGVSAADTDSLAAKRAGRVVVLGGPRASESYLSIPAVVHAAVSTGCTAVHPGYGFLSEQPAFAVACSENGLIFIGPSVEQLTTLGDKLSARGLAESLGVPLAGGGEAETLGQAAELAESIGFPVLIKAAHGGGGRGMKLVEHADDFASAWQVASAEAEAAFGNGTVFVESYISDAKHVEVQIIGDRHGHHLHLGERECSVQYRYQKVMEEAPCVALPDDIRSLLHESALRIATALDYVGLGTVEFLYDTARRSLNFLEVNPRLQVEHPVTEAVTGIDLVREQILVALGEPLGFTQADVEIRGHAIEARITAQDPTNGLTPSPGRVTRWRPPATGGLRLDSHIYEGYLFPPYYDALMGKLISYGADRGAAVDGLYRALARFEIEGINSNLPLLCAITSHDDFRDNTVTTHWLAPIVEELAHG
jgi:acetyl-CoA carboxylase, biotin carboxylase subunit